jgi:hypothetical protein
MRIDAYGIGIGKRRSKPSISWDHELEFSNERNARAGPAT